MAAGAPIQDEDTQFEAGWQLVHTERALQSADLLVPADAFGVLAIGATDLNGNISALSSRGPTADGRMKPELVAPGQGVRCANATGG